MIIPSKEFINDLKQACIKAGFNARLFCGNERQAIIAAAKECGVNLSDATIFETIREVDNEWLRKGEGK